jgi:hypothetical protein
MERGNQIEGFDIIPHYDPSVRRHCWGIQEKIEGFNTKIGGCPSLQYRSLFSQKWEDHCFRVGKRTGVPRKSQISIFADATGSEDSVCLDFEGSASR